MMYIVESDIAGEPLQQLWQFQIGRALQRRLAEAPLGLARPKRVVEPVLHGEQGHQQEIDGERFNDRRGRAAVIDRLWHDEACHEADGTGSPRVYPPLPGNANLQSANPASILRIVLDGAQTVTTPRAPNTGSMPAYAKQLGDQQVADVVNYVRNSWGNAAPLVTPDEVEKARR